MRQAFASSLTSEHLRKVVVVAELQHEQAVMCCSGITAFRGAVDGHQRRRGSDRFVRAKLAIETGQSEAAAGASRAGAFQADETHQYNVLPNPDGPTPRERLTSTPIAAAKRPIGIGCRLPSIIAVVDSCNI
jgi:hypothetical protein